MGTSSSGSGREQIGGSVGTNNAGGQGGGSYNSFPSGAKNYPDGNANTFTTGDGWIYNRLDGSKRRAPKSSAPSSSGGGGSSSGGGGGGSSGGSSRSSNLADTRASNEAQAAINLQDALTGARSGLNDEFLRYGIDLNANGRGDADRFGWQQSSYNDEINRYLDQISSTIAPGDLNPGQYFVPEQMFGDLRNTIEGDARNRFGRELDAFGDRSVTDARFGSDFGADISQGVFDQQFGDAQGALDRSFKRGTLSESAYDRAVGDLTGSRTGASGRLDAYREGVLGDYRNQLNTTAQGGYDALSKFDLGDSFDSGGFQTQLDDKFNSLSNQFEGNFKNTIGNEKFFDWNTLIGTANANSGAENTKYNAPLWMQAKQETDANNDQFRGIGSQGGF